MRQTNVRGNLSLRGFRKLRTGAIVATGVILLGLGFLAPTVSASEQDGVWVARTVEEVKADLQKEGDLFKYVIKWGDTLSVISEASNIPVDVLQEMNQASGKNLFLPHNELYFTEAETVSDTVTKHKIVIKESGASGEVRTYEVLLKKDQETKAVTFELTDVTEKVEKMTVNYSPVYQSVSAPVVERAEESGEEPASETSAETSPEVKEETEAPVAPKAEDAATIPAPKETAPEVVTPSENTPAPSKPETPASTEEVATEPKVTESEVAKPATSKAETPTPKVEEPATPAPKDDESASSVESPLTGNHSEESGAPSTTPTGDSTATQPSDSTSAPVTPSEEAPVTSGDTNSTTQPAGETGKSETPSEPSNTPSAEATNESGNAAESSPVTDNTSSNTGTADQPVASNPSSEEPTASAPKAEEPATTPKEDTPSEEVAPKDEKLEEAKKDGKDAIEKIAASKLSEIEKVKDEAEKAKLEAKLKELKEAGLEAINNAKDHDAAVDATDEYQTKIDEINVPGEELPAPNYNKDNLSTGRNDGTTIEGGSTAIGHGSGEAPSGATQPAPAEGTDNSSVTTSSTQPATGTNSDSTGTAQPQPAVASPVSSAQPTNESSASTGAATEPTSDSAPTAKPQPVATSETETSGTSSFRRAGEYRATARRVARSVNEPEGTINISYNYDGMPDIHGFFADPGENNTVTVTNSTTEDKVKELVKAKIQAKANELAKHGYKVKEEIVFEQDTTVKNFNYVVTFTKETTGTTGFRIAPKVQVRAKKVVKRDLSNKTKYINVYYNLTSLKDIAGALGELGGENVLTFSGETSKEELKRAVEEKTKAQIEKLKKQGFTVTSKTDLDQIIEGGDSYNYVVEFTKESKTQPVGTTGFRKAPLVQRRAKRSTEVKETVNVNIYFNLKTLPGIAGALDVDGDTTIKLPKNASKEEVKQAIKAKIAKVENRGYRVNDFYFGAKTEKGYDYVVEFTK